MTQRWLIRVASHTRHGGGHVARCGNLGSALARVGADVMMQLDPDSPDAAARLRRLGLATSEVDMLPSGMWDGSVVDGYELMEEEAADLARRAPPLVAIDDFLSPPEGAALVVNSALHLVGECVGETPALLGPRFAMIDPRYAQLSPKPPPALFATCWSPWAGLTRWVWPATPYAALQVLSTMPPLPL